MTKLEDFEFFKKHVPFVKALRSSKKLFWSNAIQNETLNQGQQIRSGNDGITGLILIKTGSLRVFLLSEDKHEITLYRLRSGDACILSSEFAARFNTLYLQIEADTDCEILLIEPGTFGLLCEGSPRARIYFSDLLSERLFISTQVLKRTFFGSIEKRLAFFLIVEPINEKGKIELTHDQIARHIGCTREAITKCLDGFENAGLVKLGRGNIIILNQAGLEELTI